MYQKGFGMLKKLNLGCGFEQPEGWINVDKLDYEGNIIADVLEGLPFGNDTMLDEVVMNHTLQMFRFDELDKVLQEVKRCMKKGAKLRILTPDMDRAILNYQTGNASYFPIDDVLEPSMSGKFARYLFWHSDTKCAFSFENLQLLLHRNGFRKIRLAQFGECELDTRESESLIVECVK